MPSIRCPDCSTPMNRDLPACPGCGAINDVEDRWWNARVRENRVHRRPHRLFWMGAVVGAVLGYLLAGLLP